MQKRSLGRNRLVSSPVRRHPSPPGRGLGKDLLLSYHLVSSCRLKGLHDHCRKCSIILEEEEEILLLAHLQEQPGRKESLRDAKQVREKAAFTALLPACPCWRKCCWHRVSAASVFQKAALSKVSVVQHLFILFYQTQFWWRTCISSAHLQRSSSVKSEGPTQITQGPLVDFYILKRARLHQTQKSFSATSYFFF